MDTIITQIIIFALAFIPTTIWFYIFNKENPKRKSTSIFAIVAWSLSTIPVLFYQKLWWFEWNFIFFKLTPVNFQDNIISLFWFSSFNSASLAAWNSYFSAAAIALFCAFLWVWFLEEFFKHIVINQKFIWLFFALVLLSMLYYTFISFAPITLVLLLAYLSFLYLMPKVIKFKSIDDAISIAILSAIWFSFIENLKLNVLSKNKGTLNCPIYLISVFSLTSQPTITMDEVD